MGEIQTEPIGLNGLLKIANFTGDVLMDTSNICYLNSEFLQNFSIWPISKVVKIKWPIQALFYTDGMTLNTSISFTHLPLVTNKLNLSSQDSHT